MTRLQPMRSYNPPTTLDKALSGGHIPRTAYDIIMPTVNSFLPTLRRLIALRENTLGLTQRYVHDMYLPIVDIDGVSISYGKAKNMIMNALAPLGSEYLKNMQDVMKGSWASTYESTSQSENVYDTYSYLPINYINNDLDRLFAFARKIGKIMHSHYVRGNQADFVNGSCSIFQANIASMVNEALLMEYMLSVENNLKIRVYVVSKYLERFQCTVFGQVLLNETAHNQQSDSFQHIIIYCAAVTITRRIMGKSIPRESFRHGYMNFLKSGCSDNLIDLLKKSHIDITSNTYIQEALIGFSKLVTEFEGFF